MNILLEIFGYCGTALVLLSMMMTSVKLLRILNLTGAAICAVYAILTHAWPIAVLNLSLIVIHTVKLCRMRGSHQKRR